MVIKELGKRWYGNVEFVPSIQILKGYEFSGP
jgi:hypothetical protein